MNKYSVKLDKWASATTINAETESGAIMQALGRYPVCDCGCGQKVKVESITLIGKVK